MQERRPWDDLGKEIGKIVTQRGMTRVEKFKGYSKMIGVAGGGLAGCVLGNWADSDCTQSVRDDFSSAKSQ